MLKGGGGRKQFLGSLAVLKGGKQQVDAMCPLKQFKVRNSEKPWFSNELLEQIKNKDRALRRLNVVERVRIGS